MQSTITEGDKGHKLWRPDRAVSRGATAYHEAAFNTSWMNGILDELITIAHPNIHKGDIVVDFGAGTGISAISLLKYLGLETRLWLVDNSPSWLGKAYELLNKFPNVEYYILEKKGGAYNTLAETIGNSVVDCVVAVNTVHLVPDIKEVFAGIAQALKKGGTFIFQTANFLREGRPQGALMIDSTVKTVHNIALDIVRKDPKYAQYRVGLDERVNSEEAQRKFVFPEPRHVKTYLDALKEAGFNYEEPHYVPVKVMYSDWLNFLRVRRLQAGILPEIGGKEPTPEEERDRDALIAESALKLFKDMEASNPLADDKCFTIDVVYVAAFRE